MPRSLLLKRSVLPLIAKGFFSLRISLCMYPLDVEAQISC